jgi:hypothetical protein
MPDNPPPPGQNPTISLVRADDLLALTFELINVALDKSQEPPRLVRSQAGAPAFMIVHLPPQHIAEEAFEIGAVVGIPPISSVLAGPSRLAFRWPDDLNAVPFTLDALLDWERYQPSMAANALPDLGTEVQLVSPDSIGSLPTPKNPDPTETAIELPYRLIMSPDHSAGWAHSKSAVISPEGRSELWHTRLGVLKAGRVDETGLPAVRPIWTRDSDQPAPPADVAFTTSLEAGDRNEIVTQSANFALRVGEQRLPPPIGLRFVVYVPRPLRVDHLMLSPLGGWLASDGAWNFPIANRFGTTQWAHTISMGRDQYVRVVQHGCLYPCGHRASKVEIFQRELAATGGTGPRGEYLIKRLHVCVNEPEKDYAALAAAYASSNGEGGEMPLRRLRITTPLTPELSGPSTGTFPIQAGGNPFPFHFHAEDWETQSIDFSLPQVFVPVENLGDTNALGLAKSSFASTATADLRQQAIAFANSGPLKPGACTLSVKSLTFAAQDGTTGLKLGNLPSGHPQFLPFVVQASASIPAIDNFLGSSNAPGQQTIRLSDTYLQRGFVAGDEASEVFATLVSPPTLEFPAPKVGGLVTPSFQPTGLSRSLGPVPNLTPPPSGDNILDQLSGNLIGGVSLKDVIAAATAANAAAQLPKLITTQTQQPSAVVTSFEWQPEIRANVDANGKLTSPLPPLPLVTTDNTQLHITATLTTPLDDATAPSAPPREPTFVVDGFLTNFALSFAGIVLVTFDQLHFRAERGKKVVLDPQGVHIEFMGELSFVNRLAEILPASGFSDGPALSVTAEGVTAGYTLGIPNVGVGAFSLENIALLASLSLPVNGPVGFRVSFSERYHPFLVTYSLVGGGGFLGVSVNTKAKGIERVEGSLELGGNITISLLIVEANAHVLLGFYFGLTQDDEGQHLEFTAYIRVGASVDLFGLIGISIEMYLGLTLGIDNPKVPGRLGTIGGRASLTVGVHLLFVDKSFTLTFDCKFDIPTRLSLPLVGSVSLPILSDPSFDEMVSPDDWKTYCKAFA